VVKRTVIVVADFRTWSC